MRPVPSPTWRKATSSRAPTCGDAIPAACPVGSVPALPTETIPSATCWSVSFPQGCQRHDHPGPHPGLRSRAHHQRHHPCALGFEAVAARASCEANENELRRSFLKAPQRSPMTPDPTGLVPPQEFGEVPQAATRPRSPQALQESTRFSTPPSASMRSCAMAPSWPCRSRACGTCGPTLPCSTLPGTGFTRAGTS